MFIWRGWQTTSHLGIPTPSFFKNLIHFFKVLFYIGVQLTYNVVLVSVRMKWSESVSRSACPTLCDPVDCSPPGSSDHGILQATILEWVALPPSRGSPWPRDPSHLGLLHCRQFLYHLSHQGMAWMAIKKWGYFFPSISMVLNFLHYNHLGAFKTLLCLGHSPYKLNESLGGRVKVSLIFM